MLDVKSAYKDLESMKKFCDDNKIHYKMAKLAKTYALDIDYGDVVLNSLWLSYGKDGTLSYIGTDYYHSEKSIIFDNGYNGRLSQNQYNDIYKDYHLFEINKFNETKYAENKNFITIRYSLQYIKNMCNGTDYHIENMPYGAYLIVPLEEALYGNNALRLFFVNDYLSHINLINIKDKSGNKLDMELVKQILSFKACAYQISNIYNLYIRYFINDFPMDDYDTYIKKICGLYNIGICYSIEDGSSRFDMCFYSSNNSEPIGPLEGIIIKNMDFVDSFKSAGIDINDDIVDKVDDILSKVYTENELKYINVSYTANSVYYDITSKSGKSVSDVSLNKAIELLKKGE